MMKKEFYIFSIWSFGWLLVVLLVALNVFQNIPWLTFLLIAEPNGDKVSDTTNPTEEFVISEDDANDLTPATRKVENFQYYNATIITNASKFDEYWSEKRDYVISNILSKSHRKALVSLHHWKIIKF